MRISTSQIYGSAAASMSRGQSDLYKLNNQLSSGRRILTPADDPVAAARALVMTQTQGVNTQYMKNQGTASGQLGQVDNQLSSLTNLLQSVRDRTVQAGNTVLTNSDRQAIATELESRLGELTGIANSQNGAGDYLFSGYQGATQPFASSGASAVPPAITSPVAYAGDDGQRLLQVSASRQMAVNVAGSDLFMNAKSGNGTFVAATGGNIDGSANQGAGTIGAGSVLDPQKWQAGMNDAQWSTPGNPALQIQFAVDASGASTYQVYDVSTPGSPSALTDPAPFTPGQSISLTATSPPSTTLPATDFGAQVIVDGQPAAGDTFSIKPSGNQSLFQTVQNLIGVLRTPVGSSTYSSTQFTNDLGGQLTNIDQALANVSRVQTTVGASMNELDGLGSNSSSLDIQYQQTLSNLQDIDWAKTISDFTLQQMSLEAAQKSFVKVSGMSLFSYL
jgi:flagellar hook-associated protein 3 FlgL